jgi:hypothetical protein
MLEDKETVSTIAKRYFYPWDHKKNGNFPKQEIRDIHALIDTIFIQEEIIKRLQELLGDTNYGR